MKRGEIDKTLVIFVLILVGFSLFGYFSNLGKKEISGSVVGGSCGNSICDSVNGENWINCPRDCVPTNKITKKVLLVVYDPIITSQGNKDLISLKGWGDPVTVSNDFINQFKEASRGFLNYEIVGTIQANEFPIKKDGFRYTEDTYLQCWQDAATCLMQSTGEAYSQCLQGTACHVPDQPVDYNAIINKYDLCTRFNNKEFDEIWLWGAPYFGYWESTLAGPNAFYYNSGPVTGTSCNRLLPIMGFNYERPEGDLHPFGHRAEATMTYIFGGWDTAQSRNDWDNFGHNKGQTPNVNYYQCGTVHFPPNGMNGYDYGNTGYVLSNCDDWLNYPNFQGTTKSINCNEWGCNGKGYSKWWFSHLPLAPTLTQPTNRIINNWWAYFADPNLALLKCGNGVLDVDEECDDGNLIDGDGCSSDCRMAEDYRKFFIKNFQGQNVALFEHSGDIVLKGSCAIQSTCIPPANSFTFKNSAGNVVAYVDVNGNLCLETGDCSDQRSSCNTLNKNGFFIKNYAGDIVSYVDTNSGGLCLVGKLTQNGNP